MKTRLPSRPPSYLQMTRCQNSPFALWSFGRDVHAVDRHVVVRLGRHPGPRVEIAQVFEAQLDLAFAADQFAHLLLVAHRFGVDFLDVGDARALAHHVEIGEDVRIAGIVFVERLDVVEQYLGVTHDDEGTLDVVAVLGIGRGRNVFDGDVSRTREVPRAFLSRSSGVVELDAGF